MNSDRLPFLDGLRGWASLVVLVAHLFSPHIPPYACSIFCNSRLAVAMFFVVSGFSLSRISTGRLLARSAIARYPRLALPCAAHALVDCALFPAAWWIDLAAPVVVFLPAAQSPADMAWLRSSVLSHWNQLWTLSVELTASWAIFLWIAVRPFVRRSEHAFAPILLAAYVSSPNYAFFVWGVGMSSVWTTISAKAPRPFAGAALVAAVFAVEALPKPDYRIRDAAMAFQTACLVAASAFSPFVRDAFSCRLSAFLGRISFSLYLCHMYVFRAMTRTLQPTFVGTVWVNAEDWPELRTSLLSVPVAILWAVITSPVDAWAIGIAKRFACFFLRAEEEEDLEEEPMISIEQNL
jgi:peptidoglycan/LPS O-acetylase OafA/YrhL